MKNVKNQLKDHSRIANLIVPNYLLYHNHKLIDEYIKLCYLDAGLLEEKALRHGHKGPSKQHATSDFIIRGFQDDKKLTKHFAITKLTKRIKIEPKPDQYSSDFSRENDRFTFDKNSIGDPYRLERLFAVIEGNAVAAIRYKSSNPNSDWNPYKYPKDCFSYHHTRPNSSSFINSADRVRLALAAFFAIHYLRSQLTETMVSREINTNFNGNGFWYELLERKYFKGSTYPEFIEFALPLAINRMLIRPIRWCYHKSHLILPEKNLMTPISEDESYVFLQEGAYHIPLGPKFSVFLSSAKRSDYHDLMVYGNESLTDYCVRKSIELVTYEVLLNPKFEAKFLTHSNSDIILDLETNRIISNKGKVLSSEASIEEVNAESKKIQQLMPLIPKKMRKYPNI